MCQIHLSQSLMVVVVINRQSVRHRTKIHTSFLIVAFFLMIPVNKQPSNKVTHLSDNLWEPGLFCVSICECLRCDNLLLSCPLTLAFKEYSDRARH